MSGDAKRGDRESKEKNWGKVRFPFFPPREGKKIDKRAEILEEEKLALRSEVQGQPSSVRGSS